MGKFEPARRRPSGPVFLSAFYLAAQGATVVVGACNQHDTGNRDPRNREGNSDHGVVLSISIGALLRGAAAVANRGRFPRWVHPRNSKMVVGPGVAPGDACMSGR